jgi:hypothetical protein
MGVRENFQKLIDKKTQEIRQLEIQLREAGAYVQALQDSMKLLPRDVVEQVDTELREGSMLSRARDLLRNTGKPLHVSEILKLLGKPPDKKNRVSLAGTLSGYVRQGKIFTRTGPNTFGLLEFSASVADRRAEEEELPAEFGVMN